MGVIGSIRSLSLKGTSFDVAADVDITKNMKSEKEQVPTSGDPFLKITRKSPTIEGVVVTCDADELEVLEALHDSTTDFTLSVTVASGKTYTAPGGISIENWTSQDGKATMVLQPTKPWKLFT